jgi:hypothetical protein
MGWRIVLRHKCTQPYSLNPKMHFRSPIPTVNFVLPVGQRPMKAFSGHNMQFGVSKTWVTGLVHLFFVCPSSEVFAAARVVHEQSRSRTTSSRAIIWERGRIEKTINIRFSLIFKYFLFVASDWSIFILHTRILRNAMDVAAPLWRKVDASCHSFHPPCKYSITSECQGIFTLL